MRRAGVRLAVAAFVAAAVPTALISAQVEAQAGPAATAGAGVTVVRGGAFPSTRTAQLSLVGCSSLYARTDETLTPQIGRGDVAPPLGTRSIGFDLRGGNAVGPRFYVSSMRRTGIAGMQISTSSGGLGVMYAGFMAPRDAKRNRLWIGRAPYAARAGWQTVNAAAAAYSWSEWNPTTGRATGRRVAGRLTATQFAAKAGSDGQGFFSVGMGCDGRAFDMDGWRVGSQIYDFEGLTTQTTMAADATSVASGTPVTLRASLADSSGRAIPRGTLILEQQPAGSDGWGTVDVVQVAGTSASYQVTPETDTRYRWRFVDRPLAEGSTSPTVSITVLAEGATAPSAPETSAPPETVAPTPNAPTAPTPTAPVTPSAPPSAEPSADPSTQPSTQPSPTHSTEPTSPATVVPSADPTLPGSTTTD